jgi:hypothetical protein
MGKIAFTVKRSIKATSDLKPPDCEVSVELDLGFWGRTALND